MVSDCFQIGWPSHSSPFSPCTCCRGAAVKAWWRRAWEASAVTVKPWLHSCWSLLGGFQLINLHRLKSTFHRNVASTSSIKPRLVLSRSARILPATFTGAFSSNIPGKHKTWGRKIALVPEWTHVSQFQNTLKGILLSRDTGPLERKQVQARQVCLVTHERAGDRQKYEHGCHCCPMCTPQQST